MKNNHIAILGTGSYLPETVVGNHYFDKYGSSDEWIWEHLGIRERRHAAATGQTTSDLATEAGRRAIANAGLNKEAIDLVIVATITPDRATPSTACKVLHKMDMHDTPAFDLSAACSGLVFAMSVGQQYIGTGVYKHVLVIGADTMFSTLADRESRDGVFWGDGAGAVVLGPARNGGGFVHTHISACGDAIDEVTVHGGCAEHPISEEVLKTGSYHIQMNGKNVYKSAIEIIPSAIALTLKEAGLSVDAIDHIIPHQPGRKMIIQALHNAGAPIEKAHFNMDRYANTSSATIGIMLDEVNRANKLKVGQKVLSATIGAGWTWGAAILIWDQAIHADASETVAESREMETLA
jgi:3-oxoacyl-[acyl-carrier-protein] synthase-3